MCEILLQNMLHIKYCNKGDNKAELNFAIEAYKAILVSTKFKKKLVVIFNIFNIW